MKAKDVTGHLRVMYDERSKAAGYDSWSAFLGDLQLGSEPATDAFLVLKDMIEHEQGGMDSLQRGRQP